MNSKNEVFLIDTPPPTVSGHLHMGHIFSYCHADFIARFQRMSGKNVFYPIGFDDNGLPTERLVEKITGIRVGFKYSDKSKETLKELTNKEYDGICTKQDFVEICKIIIADAEIEFEKLFKSINLSVDWNYKYQSISDKSTEIAQKRFIELFEKGLIYNKFAPVYWCCTDQTATANTEIEEKEMNGIQVEFNFHLEGGSQLKVMTTRPEMLPVCGALLFNPEDGRYKNLVGKSAIVPIFGHKIPILADPDVKIDKGTGLVMCCTYGDWQDVIWTKRHNLDEKIIISNDGKILSDYAKYTKDNGQEDYLKIEDARKKMVELLRESENLVSEKTIIHPVKCAERSGKPLEIIPAEQWYIRTLPFKNILLEMSRLLKFHPESMRIKLENWINGLSQDWCISRNRFFGIQLPIYKTYDSLDGKSDKWKACDSSEVSYVMNNAKFIHNAGKDNNWVLDTWFTSGLSPLLSSSPNKPMSLRPQAHEIIRTWTFVTLVQSFLGNCIELTDEKGDLDLMDYENPEWQNIFQKNSNYVIAKFKKDGSTNFVKIKKPTKNDIPWENVMLSGWCLASDKTKMSKSKGNIVTPTGLIEQFGSDAVRYWSGSSTLGADTAYNEAQIKVGQKLVTKLRNAANFCAMTIEKSGISKLFHNEIIEITSTSRHIVDLALVSKIANIISLYNGFMENFEYSKALDVLEKFFWTDFCDNYLELIKVRSYGIEAQIYSEIVLSEEQKEEIRKGQNQCSATLYTLLVILLKLFSPFLVNICEELFNLPIIKNKSSLQSIHEINSFSEININGKLNYPENVYKVISEILSSVRKVKSEKAVSLKTEVIDLKISQKFLTKNGIKDFNFIAGDQDLKNAICLKKDSKIEIIQEIEDIKVTL